MDYRAFADEWERAWNSHDLNRILCHYTDDVVFRSRKAVALVGAGELHGKAGLKAYWAKALQRQPDLNFSVCSVFNGHNMMVITYRNQHGVLAAETLMFNDEGRAYQASACHAEAG